MITPEQRIAIWQWMLDGTALLLVACFLAGHVVAGLLLWRRLKACLRGRMLRRVDELKPYVGKFVRHVKTGGIGFCTGAGLAEHPRWGCLSAYTVLQVVVCPGCVRSLLKAPGPMSRLVAMTIAEQSRHVQMFPAAEMTIAPGADASGFRARMQEQGEAEA